MVGLYDIPNEDYQAWLSRREKVFQKIQLVDDSALCEKDLFNPNPFIIQPAMLEKMDALSNAIRAGLKCVVSHYLDDTRMQQHVPLPESLKAILQLAKHQPYQIGMFRPDYLVDKHGDIRICEINSRFTANGMISSYQLNEVMRDSELSLPGIQVNEQMSGLLTAMQQELQGVKRVGLVLSSEVGDEIQELLHDWDCYEVSPQEITLRNGQLYGKEQHLEYLVFELDRTELLLFDKEVLTTIIEQGCYRNDVRSLILAHDKRTLAILSDDSIMSDYLTAEQSQLLQQHIIPTFCLSSPQGRLRALECQQQSVLKPNSGGRGVGILVGGETAEKVWHECIQKRADDYTIQPYIEQMKFPIIHEQNGTLVKDAMSIVGALVCYREENFGPGLIRASGGSVINIHQRRGELLACMVDANNASESSPITQI